MDVIIEPRTSNDFLAMFEKLKHPLSLPESEDSWEAIYAGLEGLKRLCPLNACEYGTELVLAFRSLHRHITSAMNSERTRLSGAALDVLSAVVSCLSSEFEPILPLFFPTLLLLCGRTNKVVASRARSCVLAIIETTQLPGILAYLVQSVKDKSPTVRLVAAEGTLFCLKCFNPPDLEKESSSLAIEAIIRSTVRDANANIRKVGKDVFQSFKIMLPHRIEKFAAPLTPTIRKNLQLSGGIVDSQRNPTSQAVSTTLLGSRNASYQQVKQSARSQPNVVSGPIRPVKSSTFVSKPNNPVQPGKPLKIIQVPVKPGEGFSTRNVSRRQPSTVVSRSFVSDKDTMGPQRVMKPSAMSTAAPSKVLVNRRDAKVTSTKFGRLSRSQAVSVSSSAHPASSQPPAGPKKQPVAGRKLPASVRPSAGSIQTGDLSRPTLSQLARARPPVARPMLNVVRGLGIRKAKSSIGGRSMASSKAGSTKTHSTKALTKSVEIVLPTTPSSIPLPPSPEITSNEPCMLVSDRPGSSMEEDQPKPGIAVAQCNEMATIVDACKVEDSTSTPIVHDRYVSDLNLDLKTPISALLSSIRQGFDLTPCSPLSPPQQYISSSASLFESAPFRLGVLKTDSPTVAQP